MGYSNIIITFVVYVLWCPTWKYPQDLASSQPLPQMEGESKVDLTGFFVLFSDC
jgi:hypothetical protein